jgi:hypothetical protein
MTRTLLLVLALSIPANVSASRAGPSDEPANLALWAGALLFGMFGIALYASSLDEAEPEAPKSATPGGFVLFAW